jgi:acetyltransferase
VLIADAWQDRDLGSLLTDYCLDIAKGWDLKKVMAVTTRDNHRMLSVLRKRGFRATGQDEGSEVYTEKELFTPVK